MDQQEATAAAMDAVRAFESAIGATGVQYLTEQIGNQLFLKFLVGREAPIYKHALVKTNASLGDLNAFKGRMRVSAERKDKFPDSLEASALLTLLTRSTRSIAEDNVESDFSVPYVPFQNREDHQLAQPATHVVLGRRGVGKSTLIRRAKDLLAEARSLVVTLDMQTYTSLGAEELRKEVFIDLIVGVNDAYERVSGQRSDALQSLTERVSSSSQFPSAAVPALRREIKKVTTTVGKPLFVFLDDFHLVEQAAQPQLLDEIHASLKGANGWMKVAGLRTLTSHYSAATRKGLQVPGDAQEISLDLTLENPEAAERHLRAILQRFLDAVGYQLSEKVLPEAAFKRLVWANAGVPRDFLQMFGRGLEHARRNRHLAVTLSDVNIAIGESGQRKMDDLRLDTRNESGDVQAMLTVLESYCLDNEKVNAFLLKSEESEERRLVRILSDLRLVHLIHQSITPEKAGQRFEAFIVDYCLFTGFRRRPNIREMVPSEGGQFRAAALRGLPKVSAGFLVQHRTDN